MLVAVKGSRLSAADGIRLYQNIVTPARVYPLIPHRWEVKELAQIQAAPIKILLSALQLCTTSHRSIVHGPTKFGCGNLSRWSTTITASQCTRAIWELNGKDRNGDGLRNLIIHQQRDMATSTNFLELSHDKWGNLLKPTWITSLWKRCSKYNIKIKGGWIHPKQRHNDQHLGDFTTHLLPEDRKLISKVLRTLRLTTLVDITTTDGKCIHPSILNATTIPNRSNNLIWGNEEHHITKPMLEKWCGFLASFTEGKPN